MQIIKTSNFDNEAVSDEVIAEKVPTYYSTVITSELNRVFGGSESSDFFKAVEDDYKLYIFEP